MPKYHNQYRLPVCLAIDTSGSVSASLNITIEEALERFFSKLSERFDLAKRIDLAIVTFGTYVEVPRSFKSFDSDPVAPASIRTGGITSMGEAIEKSLAMIDKYARRDLGPGVKHVPPLFVIVSDGVSTDNLLGARKMIRERLAGEKLSIVPVAVGEADVGVFRRLGQGRAARQITYSEYNCFFEGFADELLYRIENISIDPLANQSDIDSTKDDAQQYFTSISVQ